MAEKLNVACKKTTVCCYEQYLSQWLKRQNEIAPPADNLI